jgi:SAM-dependent methyltransferase
MDTAGQGGIVPYADLFPDQWQPQVVLMAALKVGLIEALLDAPVSPADVAETLALDKRATLRVTSVRQGDGVMVAPDARALLDPSDAAFVGDRLLHLHDLFVRWVQLPQVLRDGGPARSAHTPDSLRAFIGSMRAGARERARPLADRLAALLPATQTVLDIGGGPGTQALAFQERGWQVTVLDLPEVIDLMADDLAQAGVATIKGDATKGIPTQEFDLVFCGNLFHSMSPEECAAVVDGAADALRGGGALAIFDFLQGTGLQSSLFAVNMLVATSGGDVYGERDYRRWCEAAGLRDFAVHEVSGQTQRLLTAAKP